MNFGKRLKALRKDANLSQHELASRAGVSHRAIQDIESGSGNPTLDTLSSLAASLKITVSELCYDPDEKSRAADFVSAAEFLTAFANLPSARRKMVLAMLNKK